MSDAPKGSLGLVGGKGVVGSVAGSSTLTTQVRLSMRQEPKDRVMRALRWVEENNSFRPGELGVWLAHELELRVSELYGAIPADLPCQLRQGSPKKRKEK